MPQTHSNLKEDKNVIGKLYNKEGINGQKEFYDNMLLHNEIKVILTQWKYIT